jgi:hypothetical protein
MSTYVVTFFKHVLSCEGHLFKCPQKAFSIRHARSTDRAVAAAERLFERNVLGRRPTARRTWLQMMSSGLGSQSAVTATSRSARRTPMQVAPRPYSPQCRRAGCHPRHAGHRRGAVSYQFQHDGHGLLGPITW